jgi:type IV secretory pathway ATPase VirB11/archaellum biosynthesis ATPase
MSALMLSDKEISTLTSDEVANLAQRLETDDYNSPFEALQDWHLLRAIAFQRQDLAGPYLYLLDIEAYDEA